MDEIHYVKELRFERHTRAPAKDADAERREAARLAALSRALQPRTRRQQPAAAAKQGRIASSTIFDSPIKSPHIPLKTKTKRSATMSPLSVAKGDGDAATRSSTGSPPVYGRPFEKGNTMQLRARNRLSDEQIRDVARQAMTKAGLRQLVRRLTKIVNKGSNRDAIAAARLLLTLAGADDVVKESAASQRTMIVIPDSPPR